ncbi:MAG: hypothetical protein F6K57_36090 [Moorea sp. SIO4A5]|nr:hypothetical protein [Moorena sp. SIO4A5]
MQSLMGETTAVAHGGDPQDRAASPRPRCIAKFLGGFPPDQRLESVTVAWLLANYIEYIRLGLETH